MLLLNPTSCWFGVVLLLVMACSSFSAAAFSSLRDSHFVEYMSSPGDRVLDLNAESTLCYTVISCTSLT